MVSDPSSPDARPGRFARQTRFAPLGPDGQARLESSRVLLVGCGALGGVLAQSLVRAGVGQLVLTDRDTVELSNLPRQVLFEDRHARAGTPKVEAALESLARIGGPTRVEAHAVHVDAHNLPELARGVDLVLDGTDNLATRYVVNDLCVREGLPWIYGGVVGSGGLVMAVRPGEGPCLRCLFPEPPPASSLPTCETDGVVLPAVGAVASIQAGLALRLLAAPDRPRPFQASLIEVDVWDGSARSLVARRSEGCPCCGERRFPFLEREGPRTVRMCGRGAVQVIGRSDVPPDLAALGRQLRGIASEVREAGSLLRFVVDETRVTVFADGRALVEGTEDEGRALALYDRYVGA